MSLRDAAIVVIGGAALGCGVAYVRSSSPDRSPEHPWTWEDARRRAQGVCETYQAVGP